MSSMPCSIAGLTFITFTLLEVRVLLGPKPIRATSFDLPPIHGPTATEPCKSP